MPNGIGIAGLLTGAIAVFAVVVAILLEVIPGPHSSTDYLVIGTVATFAALLLLFVLLIKGNFKSSDLFIRRKPRS